MPCERCWADAYIRTLTDPSKSQYDHYLDLLKERDDSPTEIIKCMNYKPKE